MLSKSADSNLNASGAGAVPLAKEDRLPGPHRELAAADRGYARRADEHGLDVGIGVSLLVLERGLLRHQLAEVRLDVAGDGGVGPLVDGHPGRRVRDEDLTHAFFDA